MNHDFLNPLSLRFILYCDDAEVHSDIIDVNYSTSQKSLNKRLASGRVLRLRPPTHWTRSLPRVRLRASACVCVCLRASACVCVRLLAFHRKV